MKLSTSLAFGASLLVACGGASSERADRQARDRDYALAERAFSERRDDEAERRFVAIIGQRQHVAPAEAALSKYRVAELRERALQLDEAEAAYAEVERFAVADRTALARYRLARLKLERRADASGAYAMLREVVLQFPETGAADRACKDLAIRRTPSNDVDVKLDREVVDFLGTFAEAHPDSPVADNALFWKAYVLVYRLGDLGAARVVLHQFVGRYFLRPLVDDALWLLASIERRQGRYREAILVYEAQLDFRHEQDSLFGSYRSRRLDDASAAAGAVAFHGLRDFERAERAYRDLLLDFGSSVLRDDAYWGLCAARFARGDVEGARAAATDLLTERADSRHARAARAFLAGTGPAMSPDEHKIRSPLADPFVRGEM